jgi:hypothetical protein
MTETQKILSQIDKNTLTVEGIDHRDYPEFCDAFIGYAEIEGREIQDSDYELLNEDSALVHTLAMEQYCDRLPY